MFACLCQPSFQQSLFGPAPAEGARADVPSPLETLAREFSPRVEVHGPKARL